MHVMSGGRGITAGPRQYISFFYLITLAPVGGGGEPPGNHFHHGHDGAGQGDLGEAKALCDDPHLPNAGTQGRKVARVYFDIQPTTGGVKRTKVAHDARDHPAHLLLMVWEGVGVREHHRDADDPQGPHRSQLGSDLPREKHDTIPILQVGQVDAQSVHNEGWVHNK